MKKNILVVLLIWGWCFWIYKSQNWIVTSNEARVMYESGINNLRLVNFGLIAVALSMFYLTTKSAAAVLFLGISPWWIRYGAVDRGIAWLIFLNMLALSLIKNKRLLAGMLLIINLWPIYKNASWFWKDEGLTIKNSQVQTVIRFEQETQINAGREIIPVKFKKIAYNKFFYPIRRGFIKLAEVLDWENMASPSQKNATVANNPLSKKGIAMVPLIILGLGILGLPTLLGNKILLLGLTGMMAGWLGKSADVMQNTMLLSPVIAMAGANLMTKIPKWLRLIFLVLIIFTVKDLWYHFIYNEERWNDNKNRTMVMLADLASKTPGKLAVSEILGPTRWFYYYRYGKDERITFGHFSLDKEIKKTDTTYIGLPGEFVGNKAWEGKNDFTVTEAKQGIKIIEKIRLVDNVSYGNGDEIWVGR